MNEAYFILFNMSAVVKSAITLADPTTQPQIARNWLRTWADHVILTLSSLSLGSLQTKCQVFLEGGEAYPTGLLVFESAPRGITCQEHWAMVTCPCCGR